MERLSTSPSNAPEAERAGPTESVVRTVTLTITERITRYRRAARQRLGSPSAQSHPEPRLAA